MRTSNLTTVSDTSWREQHAKAWPNFSHPFSRLWQSVGAMWTGCLRMMILFCFGGLIITPLNAHEVVYWIDPEAPFPVMDFFYPEEVFGYIEVVPEQDEPCIVAVNLDKQTSTLINATVFELEPANAVHILVQVLRPPTGLLETAVIKGEWHATGLPVNKGCNAPTNLFEVTVVVLAPNPANRLKASFIDNLVKINLGGFAALRVADSISGPWFNVFKGKSFESMPVEPAQFYSVSKREGALIDGSLTDSANKPIVGAKLGLIHGGISAVTSAFGGFSLGRLPYGDNVIGITNPAATASVEIVLSAVSNVVAAVKAAFDAAPAPAPANPCNCTPWCAIGFASLPGGTTPVYFSGGANPPKVGPANCETPTVTVTRPNGTTFPIRPGTGRHQNSGANPAAGTWKVTTTVCGITKECSITVP